MLKVSIDRVLPLTDARTRLSELVGKTVGDDFWVLTKRGRPRVALVDVKYLDELVRRAWFNKLSVQSRAVFDGYLQDKGIDPEMATEADVEAILRDD